jgi:RNA recognition motif-containing protein
MNIYVGNFPYRTTEDDLKNQFERFGEVESVKIIMDRETGRSKGFGFVQMPNDDEAKEAIEALDGLDFSGRNLRVNEARPRPDNFRS